MAPKQLVDTAEEYVLGPEGTPFYTKRWFPASGQPVAHVLFVHGFAEHIQRYDAFFRLLAAPPHSLHITAFDQRGHGRTSQAPLGPDAAEVKAWKEGGLVVKVEKNQKHRTGGWDKAIKDLDFFVQREGKEVKAKGGKLFLMGHSMGGGLSLGFATRRTPPPTKETLSLLSGVIASGPLIRLTKPAPWLQVKLGYLAHSLGLGNMVIPVPLEIKDLTHDVEVQEKTAKDPFCAAYASLKTVVGFLDSGDDLDAHAAWNAWPKDLPLFIYHGSDDQINDPKAAVRFGDMVVAEDKTTKLLNGLFHEPHNEQAPEPQKVADMVAAWVHKRAGAPSQDAQTSTVGTPQAGSDNAAAAQVAPSVTETAPAPTPSADPSAKL